jgi:2-polyprenyl-3-methyl-5-hydroxy-6-metoxy-1,4-benzoquinol methylase
VDATGWDARYAGSDLVWGVEPNRFVVEELAGLAPGRALDIAAGEGRNAVWLAARGWQVTAVDFSRVAVERGRQLAASHGVELDWLVADLRDYRPPAEAFDAVLVAYLHVSPDDLAAVLRRCAAALAPGGRIVVIGHDLTNLHRGVGGPQLPDVLYTPEAITAALPGLTIVRAERALRPVPAPDTVVHAIDTVVTAVRT